MAAPLIVLSLPAIFAALWSGLIALIKWTLDHAHVVKLATVCILVVAAFKVGQLIYSFFMNQLISYIDSIGDSIPDALTFSLSLLSKANYCLPVSEMLFLLSSYITLAGFCIGLRILISLYRSVPFKAA